MYLGCRDGHGYPCIDQGPSLGGFGGGESADLFGSGGDHEVELEKSNVLLLGPTGEDKIYCMAHTHQQCNACDPALGLPVGGGGLQFPKQHGL